MNKSTNLTLILLFISSIASAQLIKDIFPFNREYFKSGFYISPLATVSIGNKEEGSFSIGDSTYNFENVGRGKWSYGIELGWYRNFSNLYVIDYIEAGLGYRRFKTAAEHSGDLTFNNANIRNFASDNEGDLQVLTGAIRFMGVTAQKNNRFFTYGLGINYYYNFSENYERENVYPNSFETFQPSSTIQAHIKLGYGFKVSETLILIPFVESPFITGYPTEDLNPALTFFSAKYQPIVIGLNFMFMRKDPVNCNAPQIMGAPQVN